LTRHIEEERVKFRPLLLSLETIKQPDVDLLTQLAYRQDLERVKDLKVPNAENLTVVLNASMDINKI